MDLREFNKLLHHQANVTTLLLKVPLTEKRPVNVDKLIFTFPQGFVKDNIELRVTTLFSSNVQTFGLSECICLFKADLFQDLSKLAELPIVSLVNEPFVPLYTLTTPAPYWFVSDMRRICLSMIGGIHAFVRHVDIIPSQQPLKPRDNPVLCRCLVLHE